MPNDPITKQATKDYTSAKENRMTGMGWVLMLRGDLPPEVFSMRNTLIALVLGVVLLAIGLWRRKGE